MEPVVGVFETAGWILGIMALYLLGVVFVGLFYRKRIELDDDLTLASRQLTIPYVCASTVATWICAGAIMGAAGYAYLFGMQGVIFDPYAPVLMFILAGILFVKPLRRAGYVTVTDYFNDRYGKRMGFLFIILQLASAIGWAGGQLVALGIIISLTTGFSLQLAVIIATAVVIVACALGGLWALSRVDMPTVILITVGLFIMLPVIGIEMGWSTFFSEAANWAELPTWSFYPVAEDIGGYLWYGGLLGILYYMSAWAALGLGDITSEVVLKRALGARSENAARTGFILSGFIYLIIGTIPVLLGIFVFTYGLDLPVDQAEYALPWIAETFLHPVAGVLFIVALASAIVSTSGNTILTAATIFGHNIYGAIKPEATRKEKLNVTRITIVAAGLIAMGIALYFGTIYRLIVFTGAIQVATVFAAYVFGFYWKKANEFGAISSYIVGLVVWAISFIIIYPTTQEANIGIIEEGVVYTEWAIWDALYMSLIPGAAASIIALIVVSLLTQKQDPAKIGRIASGYTLDGPS